MANEKDFREAVQIINDLIDGISFLPLCWDDMVAIEVSDKVKDFMVKHSPERWGEKSQLPTTLKGRGL